MRRDMSLVRELLLRVEAIDIPPGAKVVLSSSEDGLQVEGYCSDDIDRHLRLLVEAGLLTGKPAMDGVITDGLSWAGCEFLDTVRSPEVWRRTKEAAGKIGSVSITLLGELAKVSAKSLIKERLGLDLG